MNETSGAGTFVTLAALRDARAVACAVDLPLQLISKIKLKRQGYQGCKSSLAFASSAVIVEGC
jgi:hypothetical protein